MVLTKETVVSSLRRIRSPIADYQESSGLSHTDEYSFVDLIKALCQHAYSAAMNIFTMFYNLMPLLDGFTYLARFILDKLIDIFETPSTSDQILKSLIFVGELIVLFILVYLIMTFILLPILHLVFIFLHKIYKASFSSSK